MFFIHQGKQSDFMFREMLKVAGYYANAILKFKILFPVEYPNRPPVVQFTSDVFHPLIRQKDGIMNIKTRFRIWRSVQRDNDASQSSLTLVLDQTNTRSLRFCIGSSQHSRCKFCSSLRRRIATTRRRTSELCAASSILYLISCFRLLVLIIGQRRGLTKL